MADDKEPEDLIPPIWLDATFVQEALRCGGMVNSQVQDFSVRAATVAGYNYASTLYRVKVTLSGGEQRWLVMKVMPPGDMAQFVKDSGLFRVESLMLGTIVPNMEALLERAAPGMFPPLTPRALLHGSSPEDFLVMDDLATEGFKMADRYRGLGLRHCLLALRALARFHAASVAVLQRDVSAANVLGNAFTSVSSGIKVFVKLGPQCTAITCRSWPGFEEYAPLLDAFSLTVVDKYIELHDSKPETFNVILHGDFWINNIMFRYENGQPQDVRLVDLQMSHVGPAILDLLHFLTCSPSEDVSIHHQDLLIREYHKVLVETMKLLGLKPPSIDTILADFHSHGAYMLMNGLILLPITKARNIPNMDDVMAGDPEAIRSLYEGPVVKRWLQRTIPEYRRKGWLPG